MTGARVYNDIPYMLSFSLMSYNLFSTSMFSRNDPKGPINELRVALTTHDIVVTVKIVNRLVRDFSFGILLPSSHQRERCLCTSLCPDKASKYY